MVKLEMGGFPVRSAGPLYRGSCGDAGWAACSPVVSCRVEGALL